MATENILPVNGYAIPSSTSPAPGQTQPQSNELAKEEIGWYFVERYYNTLSKSPENLYLLYNKRSQFVAGVEEEKVHVSIGLKAINDRVKELSYHNCKVRITNVDSQSSDMNIVVQVIGEMTNDSKPHRKFVQTFVLAPQPQGYFLLNDILRFIAEEDEEPLDAQPEAQREAQEDVVVPMPAPAKSPVEVNTEETAKKVDEQLEEIAKENENEKEEEPVNGTSPEIETETDAEPSEEEPKAAEPVTPVPEPEEKAAEPEKTVEKLEPEKPVDPAPTPVETKPPAKPVSAPSKPAVPMSWAQRLAANAAKSSAPASASAPAPATSTAPAAPSKQATAPAPAAPAAGNAATPAAQSGTPVRQPSPVDSNGDGSQGGWQTAGADHNRTKSRPQAQAGPTLTESGHVRAYVKNVYQSVKADELKTELSKYGELAYFDVSRQKNSAFVEFATVEGFRAAVAANPHKIGNDSIVVEERRPAAFNARGGARGGGARGASFDGRNQQHRTGFAKEGSPRGGSFTGNRGARGQAPGVAGKGRPQAV